MALQHALSNAVTAAGESPVRIELGPDEDRVRIAFVVDRPPPATVQPIALRPDLYERLAGSAAERRGLDLAIAARISELFGGSARLDVVPGQSSTIVLDWPARLSAPG
jgi:signal transduction histidine kinase